MWFKPVFYAFVLVLAWSATVLPAAASEGGADHPLVDRHPEAEIDSYSKQGYVEYRQLVGPLGVREGCCDIEEENTPLNRIQGELTRIVYSVPKRLSALELFESHRQSLESASYEILFQCVDSACGEFRDYQMLNGELNVVYGLSYLAARSADGSTHVALAFVPESSSSDSWEYAVDVAESRPLVNRIRVLAPERSVSTPESAPEPLESDVAGSSDHPLFPRHPSASIHHYSSADFEQFRQLLGPIHGKGCCELDLEKTRSTTAEGKLTRILYRLPAAVTRREIMDSYQQSLNDSGYEILFQCEDDACGEYLQFDLLDSEVDPVTGFHYIAAASADGRIRLSIAFPEPNSDAYNEFGLSVLEERDMQNRITVLSPDALKKALDDTGKAVLGGIFFEHDSAALMPSSDQALEQVAAMMERHPELKIYVVGHTDNRGELDYNRELSERRAQAVADRLIGAFNIAQRRLEGFGVASLAPQSTNASEDGQAKNRRVELVAQ
ncbi:OmpA family protein [Marinobacter salicampi]|uniref:OmpA family protein n=1 Tax=Marinobacter salicampi TaxID=435907 RepID=UPI00140DE855|nr:OmpA family protein [Marinobacter salicampi]